METVGNSHEGEEAVIYVAYFKTICAFGAERRDKGSALFHIIVVFILSHSDNGKTGQP